MKAEDFLDSIEQIDDNFITEAAPKTYSLKPAQNSRPMRIALSAVACAAAVAGITLLAGHVLKVRDGQNSLVNANSSSDFSYLDFNAEPSDAEELFNLSDYSEDGDPVKNFKLEEFPDLEFVCTQTAITEIGKNFEHNVGSGMPIYSVYAVDLNGDGYREIAYGYSSSGIVGGGVNVYDIKHNSFYTAWGKNGDCCRLELRDNKLYFDEYNSTNPDEITATTQLTASVLFSGVGGTYTFTGDYDDLMMNPIDEPEFMNDIDFSYDRILGRYDAVVYGHFVGRPCQPTDPNSPADENTTRAGMQNNFFVDEFLGGVCDVVQGDVLTVRGPCFVSDNGENLSYKFESGMLFAPFTEDSYWILYLKRTGDEWNGEADAVNFLPISGLSEQFSVLEVPDVLDEIRESVPDRYANAATVFYDNGKCVNDWILFQANVGDRYYYKTFLEGGISVMDMDDNVFKTLDVDKICAIYLCDLDGDGKREMICAEPPSGDTYKICVYSETQDFTREIDKDDELCVQGDNLCVHYVDNIHKYTPLQYYLDIEEQTSNSAVKTVFDRTKDGMPKGNSLEVTLDCGQTVRIGLDNTYPESISLKGHEEDLFYTGERIVMVYLADLDGDGMRELIATTTGSDYKLLFVYSTTMNATRKISLPLVIKNGQLCFVDNGKYTPLDRNTVSSLTTDVMPEVVLDGALPSGGIKFNMDGFPGDNFVLSANGLLINGKYDLNVTLTGSPTQVILEDLNADGYREILLHGGNQFKIVDYKNNYMYTLDGTSDMKFHIDEFHEILLYSDEYVNRLMDNLWLTEELVVSAGMNPRNYDCVLKPNLDPGSFANGVTSMEFDMLGYYQLYYGFKITAVPGANVFSPASGKVDFIKCDSPNSDENYLMVILGDDGRYYSVWFDHAKKQFSEGDSIDKGDILGGVPKSGEFTVECTANFPFKRY